MTFLNILKQSFSTIFTPLVIVLALWATPLHAEEPASPALWKLTDADSEVWLFGTIHILDPNVSWHSEKVSTAFNEAEFLMLEAPVLETPPETMQQIVMKYARNPSGVTLSSLLSQAGNKKIIEALVSFGVPENQALAMRQQFEPLRPWIVGLQLGNMQMQSRGADPSAGVETILTEAAKDAGKQLRFLETVEAQIRVFADLSSETETRMLEESLAQMLETPDLLDGLVHDWRKGKAEEVGEALQAALQDPEVYTALLTNRNQDWARQIKTIMDGAGKYFIAVGTGHLVGKNSVQDFLKLHGLNAVRQ